MKQWRKFVVIEHIIAGVVMFAGEQEDFFAWANEDVCENSEGDNPNLLVIYHAGEEDNTPVPGNEEADPGAFTFGQPEEFLLMKLVLCPPPPDSGDAEQKVSLTVKSGDVTLLNQDKTGPPPTLEFSPGEIPSQGQTFWVKANTPSEHERDIEICADFLEECTDTVNATALLTNLDIDAHWPGVMNSEEALVSDAEENNPLNLVTAVNDDDDNVDNIVDNDPVGSPTIDPEDDELITVIVRKFEHSASGDGTLELAVSTGLRLFRITEDGTEELLLPLNVNLADPDPNNPLTEAVKEDDPQDVSFLLQANIPSEDAVVALIYTQDGQVLARDDVHLTVIKPEVSGSFTRGYLPSPDPTTPLENVDYSMAVKREGKDTGTGKAPDTWYVSGELTEDRPLSVLIPVPTQQLWYKSTEEDHLAWKEGRRSDESSFGPLAAIYNNILTTMLNWTASVFTPGSLFTGVSKASIIDTHTLESQYCRIDSITDPGMYTAKLSLQKPGEASVEKATYLLNLAVLKLDLDARRPGTQEQPGELVDDADENKSTNLFLFVNDDDDNEDGIADNNRGEAPAIDSEDDDLIHVIVRTFESTLREGTLKLSASDDLRFFRVTPEGTEELLLPLEVNLASPDPTNPLTNVVKEENPQEIMFLVEAKEISKDAVIELLYTLEGQEMCRDEVHLNTGKLEMDAYWPGMAGHPGPPVDDLDEDDPLNLFLSVNDDDDNGDSIVDHDITGSPTVEAADDELMTVIVKQFDPLIGTLELSASDGLRIFTADGTQELTLPEHLTVDFASPPSASTGWGQGFLADVLDDDMAFLVEADTISDDAVVNVIYTKDGQEIARDEIHLTVVNPNIKGGFTEHVEYPADGPPQGTVRYRNTFLIEGTDMGTGKMPDQHMLGGEPGMNHPFSLLIPVPENIKTAAEIYAQAGKASEVFLEYRQRSENAWKPGEPSTTAMFGSLAQSYNTIISQLLNSTDVFSSETLLTKVSEASAISQADLAPESFQVSPQYFLINGLTEPGVYEVRLYMLSADMSLPNRKMILGSAEGTLLRVDLNARWSGTMNEPGPVVTSFEEDNPLNLFLSVNDDDDNLDDVVDNDRQYAPTIVSEDDELIRVTVKPFELNLQTGRLELVPSPGLRIFSADNGTELTLPLFVDLANPTGPLADIMNEELTFLVEADSISDDASVKWRYKYGEQEVVRDEVHLTVVNPEVKGGFTRGDVEKTATQGPVVYRDTLLVQGQAMGTGKTPDRRWLWGQLNEDRPLSLLMSVPAMVKTAAEQYIQQGKASELFLEYKKKEASAWTPGEPLTESVFGTLATEYNTSLAKWTLPEVFTSDSLLDKLSQALNIERNTLLSPEFFVMNDHTEPGIYEVRFYMMSSGQNRKMILGTAEYALVRVDLDVYHGKQNSFEVGDDREELRGAFTVVNRNDTDADGNVDNYPQDSDGVVGEVDLMQLDMRPLGPSSLLDLQGFKNISVTLEVVDGTNTALGDDTVVLWKQQTKDMSKQERILPISPGMYEFMLSDLASTKTIWVEVIKPTPLRDIGLKLAYKEGFDTVKATGIWPEVDVREEDRQNDNTARPYNRVGRNDPRLCEDLSNPYNDDCRTINKLLVWHDSGNDEAITFEVVKTEGNHSPIWVQIKEKGNLNAGTGVWSSCKCQFKLLEQDSEIYPSLKVSSNPLVPDSILIGSAVEEIPDSRRDDYFVSDFVIEYGIDYDDSGGLSGEEIKGEYEIFGVTSFDYLEAIRRYDDIYLPYAVWELAQALCYRFSHGEWEEPGMFDFRPDKDGSCAPGGKPGACTLGHDETLNIGDLTHNFGAIFTNHTSIQQPVEDTYGGGGKYPRQYYGAKIRVPIYEHYTSSHAPQLILLSENFRNSVAKFLFTKHKNQATGAMENNVSFADIDTAYRYAGTGHTRSISLSFTKYPITFKAFLHVGIGGATLNPDSINPGTITVDVTPVNSDTYEIEVKKVKAEVLDTWDYNYFKPGKAKATLASVSGSSIQSGFRQNSGLLEKAGQVATEKYHIEGSVDLFSGSELVDLLTRYPGIKKIRVDRANRWFLFDEVNDKEFSIEYLYN